MNYSSPRKRNLALLAVAVATVAFGATAKAATVFSENFGTLADGTPITTANTSLTYARVGSGGGALAATNPSTIGTGASATITGPTGTSLTGLGVTSGLGLTSQADLSFDLKFGNATTGTLFMGMGSGTTFTGNGTFAGADLFLGLQSLNGVLQYRNNSSSSGAWVNAGFTFSSSTAYHVEADQTGSNLQLTINGTPLTLITDSKASQNADGFRIYAVSGASTYELDNIAVTGTVVAAPEPASLGILALGGLLLLRRKK